MEEGFASPMNPEIGKILGGTLSPYCSEIKIIIIIIMLRDNKSFSGWSFTNERYDFVKLKGLTCRLTMQTLSTNARNWY